MIFPNCNIVFCWVVKPNQTLITALSQHKIGNLKLKNPSLIGKNVQCQHLFWWLSWICVVHLAVTSNNMKHKAPSCCFVKQTVQKTAVWKQNVSFLLSKCSRLLFTSAQIFFKRHHRHRVQRAVQTFRCSVHQTSSRSVCQSAQMLCSRTVCWRFMSQGASGPRGYHIMRMMALLSWVPSQKTRRAGAGRWVTGIQNMLHRTKDISLVVRGWMSCRFGEKQERERLSFRIHRWPFEYHTSRLRVSRRWPMMASDVASIWQSWRRSWCACRADKEADPSVF